MLGARGALEGSWLSGAASDAGMRGVGTALKSHITEIRERLVTPPPCRV